MDLRFTSWNAPRVDVCSLERGEEELNWTSRVAMRPSKEDWYIKLLEDLLGGIACVVLGIVEQDHRILSPARPLCVQLLHHAVKEDLHDRRIRV